jgi:FkbM family methyltransferase
MNIAFIREVGLLQFIRRKAVRQYYKRIAKRDHAMLLPTGESMNLPISDLFATEAFITNGNVDWGSEALLFSLLEKKGAFFDIGSHIGYYALYMLPRITAVYAFEPDPKVRVLLESNVAGKPKIHVLPVAAGAKPGRARFTLEPDSAISHFAGEYDDPAKIITIDVVTLDNFVRTRGLTVEAIKIDVEGHDTEVIQGALNVLNDQQPIVLTEAIPDAALFALTRKVGYRVFAYVSKARSPKKSFAELLSSHPIPGRTKMLFLVPRRLAEKFESLLTQPVPSP